MAYGLPAHGDPNWDTKLNDSIGAVKVTADAAQPAASLEADVATKVGTAGALDTALSASIEATAIVHLGAGTADDTTRINGLLALGATPKGKPGEVYTISAPLVGTKIDMTGATVQWKTGVTGKNLFRNPAATAQRSIADGVANATTAFTSATAAFTAADVGRSISIYHEGVGATTQVFTAGIASITDAATVVLSLATPFSGTALNANIHDRDKHVRVIGGTWDRGAAVGSTSKDLSTIVCHFADDVTVEPENILSTALGAKYAIWLAAVTQVRVLVPDMDVISDGLHINGPASGIDVPHLAGKTGDDMFALVGQDYPDYLVSGGDIKGVHVGTMIPRGSLAGHKILAGNGFRIDNVKVDFTYGSTGSYAAWIGADQNYDATKGGTYGRIDLGVLDVACGGELLKIVDCDADKIIVTPLGDSATGQKIKVMQGTTAVGGTVKELVTKDARAGAGQTLVTLAHSTVTVKKLLHERPRVESTGLLHNNVAGTVTDMTVDTGDITYTGTTGPIYGAGGTIGALTLVDTTCDTAGSSGIGAVVQGAGMVCSAINVVRGTYTGAGATRGVIAYSPANTGAVTLTLDNCRLVTMKRVAYSIAGLLTARLIMPVIDTAQEPFDVQGGATITGILAALTTATQIITSSSTGTIRVNGATIPVNVSLLTPSEGDQARNISSAAAAGVYVGPVVWDSSATTNKWIPLRGYAAIGGGTLAAGTLTVAHAAVTATTRIALEVYSPSNPGALYVSSKTAGTGFVITSTNAADNSVVRWKIINY